MLITIPIAQHSMSLNALEADLLEIKKDEIWQLMYVQRQSEGEAYANLASKTLLGRLGEQNFREIVHKWERDDPEVWPARPEYWATHGCAKDQMNFAYESYEDGIELYDEISKNAVNPSDQHQSDHYGTILYDPCAHGGRLLGQRRSTMRKLQSLRDAGCTKSIAPKIDDKKGIYPNPPLNAQKLSLFHSQEEPPESRAGSWLLNMGLDPDALPTAMPYSLSQSIYCSKYPQSLFQDSDDDDSLQSLYARDVSSIYIGCQSSAQQIRKPATQIFGFLLDGDEQSTSSDDDEEYLMNLESSCR